MLPSITATQETALQKHYVPPAIGNGDLSLLIDYTGSMKQKTYCGMVPEIFRAGNRYDSWSYALISFGHFLCNQDFSVKDWTQTLHLEQAFVSSVCRNERGDTLESMVFCHAELPVIAVRQKRSDGKKLTFRYEWNARRVQNGFSAPGVVSAMIDTWTMMPMKVYLLSDGPVRYQSPSNGVFCMETDRSEAVFFLAFGEEAAAAVKKLSYEGLRNTHCSNWSAYWKESKLPDYPGKLGESGRCAEYHLKISSTRWSIPTGIYATHWHGKYFGFDEYFPAEGLLAAGHLALAKKVADFRFEALDGARKNAESYFGEKSPCAKYCWESIENPQIEGAPQGHWLQHIFHMAHIALETYDVCRALKEPDYLRNSGYPVIRACAEFFRIDSLTEYPDGSCIVRKCTDLERLGSFRENAFMTTCGVIATFRAAAECAEKLAVDADLSVQWKMYAGKLLETLPNDGEKYTVYPNCDTPSIALLSGIYPYRILPADDGRQKAATDYFIRNEDTCGNMYPGGKSICTWYACWKAIALIRLGRRKDAEQVLKQCAEATGCFSEIFEIYEMEAHPWFTTAEGIYLQALMELSRNV